MQLKINHPGTYPIGTIKTVEVLSREVRKVRGREIETLAVAEKRKGGEGFVLYNSGWHPNTKPGDTGIITFTLGGKLGAYWLFTPDAKR